MNKIVKRILFGLLIVLVIGVILFFVIVDFITAPFIVKVEKNDSINFEDQVIINVYVDNYFYKLSKDTWCYISIDGKIADIDDNDWQKAKNGYCSFTVKNGDYSVYVRDKHGNISDINKQKVDINKILNITTNKDMFFLYKGQKDKITYEVEAVGNNEEDIIFVSENKNVVSVDDDGVITGLDYGKTIVRVGPKNGIYHSVVVYVSSFLVKPNTGYKDLLTCKQFTSEEAQLVDKALFDRVDTAGYGTRAGVIAAARFLTTEFAYRVPYFFENGRLNNYPPFEHVDGEGRYYHRGLYLDNSKFRSIVDALNGPVTWGCNLLNYTDWADRNYKYVAGYKYPNGLDCSGFVTWALINGGFDVGDIGAGIDPDHYDLSDIGERHSITKEFLASGKVKVGDLIGNNGHAAIIAGWDDDNYYIAEALPDIGGVKITTVARSRLVGSIYTFIVLMDDVYKKDGNYTEMW